MNILKKILTLLLIIATIQIVKAQEMLSPVPHYYCTASDDRFFELILNLIGSIHKNDYANVGMIAVFDLGMNPEQRALLQRIEKVGVFSVEQKNPQLLTLFQTDTDRFVRGWFAWKPVIIKQALDMFPYILYVDAGTTILKPMEALFAHIRAHGYFLFDIGHANALRITKPVVEYMRNTLSIADQQKVFDPGTMQLDGGCQGLSRCVYHDYVYPVYLMSSDLNLFMDDGSAQLGFGQARHDQTLFSIIAKKNGYTLFPQGWVTINGEGKDVLIHMHWDKREVNAHTAIYRSRSDSNLAYYGQCIRLLW